MADKNLVAVMGEMKKNKKLWIIFFLLVVGVILLVVGNSDVFSAARETEEECEHQEKLNIDDYERALEEDISGFCKGLAGVDSVSVSVRLAGSSESIYAQNSQNGSGADRDEYVIIGSGSSSHPIYIGERSPEILGVGVIIFSRGSEVTKTEAEALLSSAYGVPLNRIYVKIIDIR